MHRKISLLAVSAALLGAGALTGCGGDDEATPAAASTPAQHESASHEQSKPAAKKKERKAESKPAASESAEPVSASIEGFAFAPQALEVKVGQEITWTNNDSAPHTVTATSGAEFDSGTMAQGATYSWKATEPGTIEYFCAIHPSMTGTITVE
jgi:plastocyanin